MRLKGLFPVCVALLLLLSTELLAADDSDARELAKHLIRGAGVERIYQAAAVQSATQVQMEIQKTIGRSISEDERQRLIFFWYSQIQQILPQSLLEDLMIQAFTKHLTAQDIREINRFYRSAPGQRFLEISPVITAEIEGIGAELGQKLADSSIVATIGEQLAREFPNWFLGR